MTKKDLWGDFPDVSGVKTPKSILMEQAEVLSEKTNGLLVGKIKHDQSGQNIDITFYIVAPALNNYSYALLRVLQPITLYPLQLWNLNGNSWEN